MRIKMRTFWRFGYLPGRIQNCNKLSWTTKKTGKRSAYLRIWGRLYWRIDGQWVEYALSEP